MSDRPVLELSNVFKDYRGLRPLRIDGLVVSPGDQVAILGLDRAAAEVFVNLVTGTALPDRGEVRVFGRSTAAIVDSADWLATIDRFGLVSERAVLLDGLSVVQNLSVPFSLEIEPPPDEVRRRAHALAREAGISEALWDRPVGDLDALARLRVRLARALAQDPPVLMLEHPTAGIARGQVASLGRDIRATADRRGIASVTLTADADFAVAVAADVLTLDLSSGRLGNRRGWGR